MSVQPEVKLAMTSVLPEPQAQPQGQGVDREMLTSAAHQMLKPAAARPAAAPPAVAAGGGGTAFRAAQGPGAPKWIKPLPVSQALVFFVCVVVFWPFVYIAWRMKSLPARIMEMPAFIFVNREWLDPQLDLRPAQSDFALTPSLASLGRAMAGDDGRADYVRGRAEQSLAVVARRSNGVCSLLTASD